MKGAPSLAGVKNVPEAGRLGEPRGPSLHPPWVARVSSAQSRAALSCCEELFHCGSDSPGAGVYEEGCGGASPLNPWGSLRLPLGDRSEVFLGLPDLPHSGAKPAWKQLGLRGEQAGDRTSIKPLCQPEPLHNFPR